MSVCVVAFGNQTCECDPDEKLHHWMETKHQHLWVLRCKSGNSTRVCVLRKHLAIINGGEPKAVGVGVIVAGSTSVTLDEWSTAEFLKTGTRRGQSLS